MPDVLTHVLVGFTLATALSIRYDWIGPAQVTALMAGALSPDFMKITLVLDDELVEAVLGIPVAWRPLHVLSGNLLVIAIAALLVGRAHRKRIFLLLVLGGLSHLTLDLLLLKASGYAFPVLWPLTAYHPPAGMLFRSSDGLPAVIALVLAGIVYLVKRRIVHASASRSSTQRPDS